MTDPKCNVHTNLASPDRPWYREMTGYHWFVLLVASLGWMFDCLDQQLFALGRNSAMSELLRGITPVQFADFSKQIRKTAPQETESGLLDGLLDNVESHLKQIERRAFWQMDAQLRAQLTSSTDTASVSHAIEQAQELLIQATDEDLFKRTTVPKYSNYATAIFLMGWATGGLIFGVLGDRLGRAKTMLITILIYSIFTGMCSFAHSFSEFAVFRFLTDLGVGGEFAVGVSLVAEVMPNRARTPTLTLLQMLSAFGNMAAAIVNIGLGVMEEQGMVDSPWRIMFRIGALPALLALVIRWKLKEPERWQQISTEQALDKQLGSYKVLFCHPRWRRNALVGLSLALSGVVGLWGAGFFTIDLSGMVLEQKLTAATFEQFLSEAKESPQLTADLQQLKSLRETNAALPETLQITNKKVTAVIKGKMTFWRGITSIFIQFGAVAGMFSFGYVAQRIGRKPTFAVALIAAAVSTSIVFWFFNDFYQVFWMMPLMGFCQLSLFAGYAVYFPELFPTSLRSTGTSFCYNVGRFLAVPILFVKSTLTDFFCRYPGQLPSIRYPGLVMCCIVLVGLVALPFAPETKGQPLPD
jgi:MFS family permease